MNTAVKGINLSLTITEAFNTMYILAQKEGYKKTPEEFKTLLSSNQEALKTDVAISSEGGLQKNSRRV
jgi:predicted amino acid-binding ACT domain protein